MPLPSEDLEVIGQWVDALNADLPPHAATVLRYEFDTDRNAVTLFECRPLTPESDWLRQEFARLRFTRLKGWELYWADRNSDFHVYAGIEPSWDVQPLLDEIDDDPTCIFFG